MASPTALGIAAAIMIIAGIMCATAVGISYWYETTLVSVYYHFGLWEDCADSICIQWISSGSAPIIAARSCGVLCPICFILSAISMIVMACDKSCNKAGMFIFTSISAVVALAFGAATLGIVVDNTVYSLAAAAFVQITGLAIGLIGLTVFIVAACLHNSEDRSDAATPMSAYDRHRQRVHPKHQYEVDSQYYSPYTSISEWRQSGDFDRFFRRPNMYSNANLRY